MLGSRSWYKGADTTAVCLFLENFFRELADRDDYLQSIFEACESANTFMKVLYHGGLWMPRSACRAAGQAGLDFIKAYKESAQFAYNLGKTRFKIQPKLHAAIHIIDDLCKVVENKQQWGWCPLADGTQMDEDLVGKVSLTSKSASTRSVHRETLSRYLLSLWGALE